MPTAPTARTKTTRTTMNFLEYIKAKRMKQLKYAYFPNYGYEPYWADGEWFLSTTTMKPSKGTTAVPKICGEECSHLLRRIDHVCGRQSGDERYPPDACFSNLIFGCYGEPGDNYNFGYTTFDTYCKFLGEQCRAKFYNKTRWVLVNLGKCKKLDEYFKPLWTGKGVISRMEWFLSSFAAGDGV